ncbi:hypothetical protein NDU88_002553 [Pleurodeles waltl]|uniref:Uncharacterized protein n=1 Tax=Pleurodeles waltl TaxID=8319 RepID=A0AAV7RFW9_PLEWA|nr:hypothetical protein NDU88_002553 [Pleurodeles waltl]
MGKAVTASAENAQSSQARNSSASRGRAGKDQWSAIIDVGRQNSPGCCSDKDRSQQPPREHAPLKAPSPELFLCSWDHGGRAAFRQDAVGVGTALPGKGRSTRERAHTLKA